MCEPSSARKAAAAMGRVLRRRFLWAVLMVSRPAVMLRRKKKRARTVASRKSDSVVWVRDIGDRGLPLALHPNNIAADAMVVKRSIFDLAPLGFALIIGSDCVSNNRFCAKIIYSPGGLSCCETVLGDVVERCACGSQLHVRRNGVRRQGEGCKSCCGNGVGCNDDSDSGVRRKGLIGKGRG